MVVKGSSKSAVEHDGKKDDGNSPMKSKLLQSKFASPSKIQICKKEEFGKTRMHVEAFDEGILVGYMDNGTNPFAAGYNRPHMVKLAEDDSIREKLNVNDIVYRRGVDGHTAMPGKKDVTWGWQAMVSIIGEDNVHNTIFKLTHFIAPVVHFFNDFDDNDLNYKFKKATKFFQDHTADPPRKISCAQLDADVLEIMRAAYPGHHLMTLTEHSDVMATFWEDIEYGINAMEMASTD